MKQKAEYFDLNFYDGSIAYPGVSVIEVCQAFPFLKPSNENAHVFAGFKEEEFNKVPDILLKEITDKWSSVRGGTVIDLGIDVKNKAAMQAFNALRMALKVNYKVRDSFHNLARKWFDMDLAVYPNLNRGVFTAEDILCGECDTSEEPHCFIRNEQGHLLFCFDGWRTDDYRHFSRKKSELLKLADLHVFMKKDDGTAGYVNAYVDCILKQANELMNDPRLFRKSLSKIMKKYILPLFEIKDRPALLDKVTSKEAVLCFCGLLEGEDCKQLQMRFPEAFMGMGISTIKSSAFTEMDFKLVNEAKMKMQNMIWQAKKEWAEKRQRLYDEVEAQMAQELALIAGEVKKKLLVIESDVNVMLKKREENGEETPAEEYMQTRVMPEICREFNRKLTGADSENWYSESC